MRRIDEVDTLRGIAIVLMVIYHVVFDLDFLRIADIGLHELPWILFQRLIGTMFLLLVGVSLVLSDRRNPDYMHHARRAAKLGIVALAITLVTWIYPHDGFIRFGIIHLIAVSALIAPLFLRLGPINIVIGIALIVSGLKINYTDIDYMFWLGWIRPDYMAFDHYPLVPWFGVVLIGLELGNRIDSWKRRVPVSRLLSYLGRNSLSIYLAHQPVILGILMLWLMAK